MEEINNMLENNNANHNSNGIKLNGITPTNHGPYRNGDVDILKDRVVCGENVFEQSQSFRRQFEH